MKITIVCSSEDHPIYPHLVDFRDRNCGLHHIDLIQKLSDASTGDVLFLVSCNEIVKKAERDNYQSVLVLHASDLPLGRGWSPHIWQVLEGRTEIAVTMLTAASEVDSGDILAQVWINISETALYDEIHSQLFEAEIALMQGYIDSPNKFLAKEQRKDIEPSYYRKRTPQDSELDINRTILEQFDLMRVCDPRRYPSFFVVHGQKFKITLEKYETDADV